MATIEVLNAGQVRQDFPFFAAGAAYLDTAATAQKPKVVLDAMRKCYEQYANVHRGAYELAEAVTQNYEAARRAIAAFVNAEEREVVFVRNATEGINLVAKTWGEENIREGDSILLTEMEHHSNIVPWQMLAAKKKASIRFVPITESGELDRAVFKEELARKPKLVAFTHVSNVLGTINPAKDIIAQAKRAGAFVLVDACQSVPHVPVDVKELGADFLVFSGHKLYGPEVGVLYGKREVLEHMPPFLGGGDMIKTVTKEGFTTNDVPWKFEAGTPNIAGAIGLAAAVKYVQTIGMQAMYEHEQELLQYVWERLESNPLVRLFGPKQRIGVISFTFGDMHAHDVSTVLDSVGVSARSGHHCAQPLMDKLGVPATVRVSFGPYTTKEDLDRFLEGLDKAKEVFRL